MNIAVFCSSSNHIDIKYLEVGFRLGVAIAEGGHTLVYGGATGGLMDSVSEGAFSINGKVIGIISQAIIRMNRESLLPIKLIKVETLNERKSLMNNFADAFVVLPGSYGTLDEMLNVVASGIVGEHSKPLILVNQDGFYNFFLQQTDLMRRELFIPSQERYKILVAQDIEQCIEIINSL
jgi:uncharacterized protein (TIGR00730 family)